LYVESPFKARRAARPNGVVETLSAGYVAINRQLWILLVPILVDVFLWLGPHVSYSPLLDPALARGTEWVQQVGDGPRGLDPQPTLRSDVGDLRQALMSLSTETNALALLARGPLALPSVAVAIGGIGALWFIYSWTQGVALLVGCLLGGLLVGGFFYASIAQQVRGAGTNPVAASRRVPRGIAHVLGLLALLVGFGLLVGLPVLTMLGFAALLAPPVVAEFGLALVFAVLLAAGIYLFFAVDAIFVSGVGPLAAVQRSTAIVRRHLWPTLGLVLLTWLILAGMDRVWQLLAEMLPPIGVGLSMLGNAYVTSGLLAASMIFYQERTEAGSVSGPRA
jgi:hypothetical protein